MTTQFIAYKVLILHLLKGRFKDDAPLCGVPFHSVEPYIAKMVKNGIKLPYVSKCQTLRNPKVL